MRGNNLPAKKYKHSSPTVRRLSFECDGGSSRYIDIAKALSIVNRRGSYRQGVYYYVNSVEVYNNESGVVDIHTLPDTWTIKNAHNRARKLWSKMNRLVSPPLISGIKPQYHDFKVYMSERHEQNGTLNPSMQGINNTAVTLSAEDWVYSKFVSADDDGDVLQSADDFTIHMIGNHVGTPDNWTSISAVKSYAESRGTVPVESPNDNNFQSNDPLVNVFDFSSEEQINEIADNLRLDNDEPPYDISMYVGESGNHMQQVARINTEEDIGRVGRASGFVAPFGLICIDPFGVSSGFRVVINLAVGTYGGVYAERV
jgi:hypothetical protein